MTQRTDKLEAIAAEGLAKAKSSRLYDQVYGGFRKDQEPKLDQEAKKLLAKGVHDELKERLNPFGKAQFLGIFRLTPIETRREPNDEVYITKINLRKEGAPELLPICTCLCRCEDGRFQRSNTARTWALLIYFDREYTKDPVGPAQNVPSKLPSK